MEFKGLSLAQLAKKIIDNRGRTCPVGDTGIPLIATNCIRDENLYPVYETARYVNEETYQNWFRGHPQPGDIIFVTKGSPGRVCLSPDPVDFCIAQDMVAIRADDKLVYPRFLFALLRSRIAKDMIENMHVGTMIPHFKKGDFDKLFLPIPDDKTQNLVGDFYFDLSNRINLLRETNATLEAIAQALFKSWFVDFDPVRAKAEGREPEGVPPEVVDLFPDELVESKLGASPKGWEIVGLDTIAKFLNGLALQKFPPEDDDNYLPVIKIAQLRKGDVVGADRASINIKPEYVVADGDILFSWSGSLETVIWCGGPGALNQHLFKVTSANFPKWFFFNWIRHHLPQFREIAAHKATTMGHIQRHHLTEAKVVVPQPQLITALSEIMEPLMERQIQNLLQIRVLTELRDTLLPRLMSGKLRITDAEKELDAIQPTGAD